MRLLIIIFFLLLLSCASTPNKQSFQSDSIELHEILTDCAKKFNVKLELNTVLPKTHFAISYEHASINEILKLIESQTPLDLQVQNGCLSVNKNLSTFEINDKLSKDIFSLASNQVYTKESVETFLYPLLDPFNGKVHTINNKSITISHRKKDNDFIRQSLVFMNYLKQKREPIFDIDILKPGKVDSMYTPLGQEGLFGIYKKEIIDSWSGSAKALRTITFPKFKDLKVSLKVKPSSTLYWIDFNLKVSQKATELEQVFSHPSESSRTLRLKNGYYLRIKHYWKVNGKRFEEPKTDNFGREVFKKAQQVVPKVHLKDISIIDSVKYLNNRGLKVKLIGYNSSNYLIKLKEPDEFKKYRESLLLNNVKLQSDDMPLGEILKYAIDSGNLSYKIDYNSILVGRERHLFTGAAIQVLRFQAPDFLATNGHYSMESFPEIYYYPAGNAILAPATKGEILTEINRMLYSYPPKMALVKMKFESNELFRQFRNQISDNKQKMAVMKNEVPKGIEIQSFHEFIYPLAKIKTSSMTLKIDNDKYEVIDRRNHQNKLTMFEDTAIKTVIAKNGSVTAFFLLWLPTF